MLVSKLLMMTGLARFAEFVCEYIFADSGVFRGGL